MQRLVASPNYAQFVFFWLLIFGFIAETHTAHGRQTIIIIIIIIIIINLEKMLYFVMKLLLWCVKLIL